MDQALHIAGLHRYPVKSLAGEALQQVTLDTLGLTGDRRWMLVDSDNRFLSQRQLPAMATIQARLAGENLLVQRIGKEPVLNIEPNRFQPAVIYCRLWQDDIPAYSAEESINHTLSQWLEHDCRLVRLADNAQRQVDRRFVPDGVMTGFADGFPLLVMSQASLDDMAERSGMPLDARHFRPNLVIAGAKPYAEDDWQEIRIGGIVIHLVKPCSRCAITTVDPDTGRFSGPKPLATLKTFRLHDGKPCLGQNAWANWPPQNALPRLRQGQSVVVVKMRHG